MNTTESFSEQLSSLVVKMQRSNVTLGEAVRFFKREWIERILRETHGNNCRTAKMVGIHRNTMLRITRQLGIDISQMRSARRAGHGE